MDYSALAVLVGTVLATASLVFGEKLKQGKGKAKQLTKLLNTVIDAAQDDEVTEKEFQKRWRTRNLKVPHVNSLFRKSL